MGKLGGGELNFGSDLFNADTTADIISTGNLFSDPFPAALPIFFSDGRVSVGYGEWGSIQSTVSGTACYMIFTALSTGSGTLYISSIEMRKKNGFEIDGLDNLMIDSIEIQVIE